MIIVPGGKRHFVRLRSGDKFHHPSTGHVLHEAVIGSPPGTVLKGEGDGCVVCLRPTLEDYILKRLKRTTSIIHPKDLASLVVRGDLTPGARVLEAGIGSGAATIFLLRCLAPDGLLISCERRREFIANAKSNVEDFHSLYGDPGTKHEIVEIDVYEDLPAEDLDVLLLDVPEPQRSVSLAWKALRPGGTLLSWLPTVTQVYTLVRMLQEEPGWEVIETRELLERSWEVAEQAMRPFHRMVAHTGFLIRARRVAL